MIKIGPQTELGPTTFPTTFIQLFSKSSWYEQFFNKILDNVFLKAYKLLFN